MKKYFLIIFSALFLVSFALADVNDTNYTAGNHTVTSASSMIISNFFPKTFNLGDSQINIQILNNGSETLRDIFAFITGMGFSTYDSVPIDSLDSGDKSYIIVSGNFREAGNITLTIKIGQEIFYQNITVINPASKNESEIERIQREETEMLNNLTIQLSDIEKKYAVLESELSSKKENNYDVSQISLADLKNYIRNTESSILNKNVNGARVNLKLTEDEYNYQKSKLDSAGKIPAVDRVKNYAIIFTTLAGAFIMIFTLYELLKKKGEHVVSRVNEVKSRMGKRPDKHIKA